MKLICVANFKDGQIKDDQLVRWKRGQAYDGKDKDIARQAIEKGLVVTEPEWKKIQQDIADANASTAELLVKVKALKSEVAQLKNELAARGPLAGMDIDG